MNEDSDFQRGYKYALDAIDERIYGVRNRLSDDAWVVDAHTLAVLACVDIAITAERESFEAGNECEERVERVRNIAVREAKS